MSANNNEPRVGYLVCSQDHPGVTKAFAVKEHRLTEIPPFLVGKQELFGQMMTAIPRSHLESFKEDARQAAARIV